MKAIHLQTEYLNEPLGLGIRYPRFYWNCDGGKRQSAYRIVVTRYGDDGSFQNMWDSGKVESSSMTQIRYQGEELHSGDRPGWTVTLFDETGKPGEPAEGHFEMGLLKASDWHAKWISGDYKPKKNTRYPADCFRYSFETKKAAGMNGTKEISRARIYCAACGLYELKLNGRKVTDALLTPGNTDLRK